MLGMTCTSCLAKFAVPDNLPLRELKCPKCGYHFGKRAASQPPADPPGMPPIHHTMAKPTHSALSQNDLARLAKTDEAAKHGEEIKTIKKMGHVRQDNADDRSGLAELKSIVEQPQAAVSHVASVTCCYCGRKVPQALCRTRNDMMPGYYCDKCFMKKLILSIVSVVVVLGLAGAIVLICKFGIHF